MTIYEFSKAYLINQTERFFPQFPVSNLNNYKAPHIFSWSPYFTATPQTATKSDVMKMFALILQNRVMLPNVIKFEDNHTALCGVTNNFDSFTISSYTPESLVIRLSEVISIPDDSDSWLKYARSIIDAAKYLESIRNFTYRTYIDEIALNPEEAIKNLCKIYGMGPALARNFIKEIGTTNYGKPDVHLYAVFQSFDPSITTPESFDSALINQANKAGVTPYELDRIIWLICSGDYFKHNLKIKDKNLRDSFVNSLADAIKNGIVTP